MCGVLLLWLRVSSLTLSLIVQLYSKLLVTFREGLQTATGAQGSYTLLATKYKQKEIEGKYISSHAWSAY
jgi:hypothetical protein